MRISNKTSTARASKINSSASNLLTNNNPASTSKAKLVYNKPESESREDLLYNYFKTNMCKSYKNNLIELNSVFFLILHFF